MKIVKTLIKHNKDLEEDTDDVKEQKKIQSKPQFEGGFNFILWCVSWTEK